ncbi:TNFAIP3-interacting protein 3 [Amia ocellicauda]|uniref:TNFAIP3-interacting protein 3 n=1 Tax=Amia ocellicauda TaxID=2972642 RepID=UPI003464553B
MTYRLHPCGYFSEIMPQNEHLSMRDQELRPRHHMESCEDLERCESVELDDNIRLYITQMNASHSQNYIKKQHQLQPSCPSEDLESRRSSCRMTEELPVDTSEVLGSKGSQRGTSPEELKQRIMILEKQRQELLAVNKKWDEQYKTMKKHYELKIMEMRKRLMTCNKYITELQEKQTDFDNKIMIAKEKIENEQGQSTKLSAELLEMKRQKQNLQEENAFLTKKKQHHECEIRRLNKVLSENIRGEETVTQIDVLKHQAQVYKEDFQKERHDRERLKERNYELEKKCKKQQSELQSLKLQVKQFPQQVAKQWIPAPYYCPHWAAFPTHGNICTLPHSPDPSDPRTHQDKHGDHQQHPPNYQWYVSSSDQLPPDVPHIPPNQKANGTKNTEK